MSIYELSNYLFVCESGMLRVGCETELLVEQKRDLNAALAVASDSGWICLPPSPWDDDRVWSTVCPKCSVVREQLWADLEARRVTAGRLVKP